MNVCWSSRKASNLNRLLTSITLRVSSDLRRSWAKRLNLMRRSCSGKERISWVESNSISSCLSTQTASRTHLKWTKSHFKRGLHSQLSKTTRKFNRTFLLASMKIFWWKRLNPWDLVWEQAWSTPNSRAAVTTRALSTANSKPVHLFPMQVFLRVRCPSSDYQPHIHSPISSSLSHRNLIAKWNCYAGTNIHRLKVCPPLALMYKTDYKTSKKCSKCNRCRRKCSKRRRTP